MTIGGGRPNRGDFAAALVDAFVGRGHQGNAAGVCLVAEDTPNRVLQAIAAELNQAETAFLIPRSSTGWILRWFTPTIEVQLCGHATIAAAYWLWDSLREESADIDFYTNLYRLTASRLDSSRVRLILPTLPIVYSSPYDLQTCFPDSVIEHIGYTNHTDILERNAVLRVSPTALRHLKPDFSQICKAPYGGIIVTSESDRSGYDFMLRYFAPACGILEDQVTGSAHACLAKYWTRKLGKRFLTALQVSERGGEIGVEFLGDRVALVGECRVAAGIRLRSSWAHQQ